MQFDKVLFLDIDGVLNNSNLIGKSGPDALDPDALTFIKILENFGVEIVISSTWRKLYKIWDLQAMLGVKTKTVTPYRPDETRGHEIKAWLDWWEPSCYAIIDDENDMLPEQQPFFVQTTWRDGMQQEHFDKICQILKVGKYK